MGYFTYLCSVKINLNKNSNEESICFPLYGGYSGGAVIVRFDKNAATLSSLSGEWNIIEINGSAVVPAPNQEFPFIGFDTKTGKVYGNSGCNRLMGSFDVNAKPGQIDLGALGSTRMMCPDMTVEKNVLAALGQVKKYKQLGKENMALCGSSNRPLIVLQKKEASSKLSDLNGRWIISEAGGQAIPSGMEKQPAIEFDIAENACTVMPDVTSSTVLLMWMMQILRPFRSRESSAL